MKTDKNILIAFILNLVFSIFEMIGGMITGSVAILSDAVHDMGDAVSIGTSYFLEKKSQRNPDNIYTYGYTRYSVFGSIITTLVLLIGSLAVIINALKRMFNPVNVDYNGMIIFAVIGVAINLAAAWFTREGNSLNQKAVNLHMLEDVLGWFIVLIGALIMRITETSILDPILSISVALFILIEAVKTLIDALNLLLEKVPKSIDINEIRTQLCLIDGIHDIHHIHVWSMDGHNHYATMHVVSDQAHSKLKEQVKELLKQFGICHATLELEHPDEHCCDICCSAYTKIQHIHHRHH